MNDQNLELGFQSTLSIQFTSQWTCLVDHEVALLYACFLVQQMCILQVSIVQVRQEISEFPGMFRNLWMHTQPVQSVFFFPDAKLLHNCYDAICYITNTILF